MHRTDHITTFMCRLSGLDNLGASTSWSSKGLSRPVRGSHLLWFSSNSTCGTTYVEVEVAAAYCNRASGGLWGASLAPHTISLKTTESFVLKFPMMLASSINCIINVTHLWPKCNVFKGEKIDNKFDNGMNKGDFSYYTVDEIL